MAIGDIVRMYHVMSLAGSDCVNVWHFQQIGTGLPPDNLTRLANGWESEIIPLMRAAQPTNLQHVELRIEYMVGGDSQLIRPLLLAGLNANTALPPQDTALFSLRSAAIGRSRRGRKYLPIGFINAQNSGVWTTTFFNNTLVPLRDRMRTVYGPLAIDWEMGVFSRKIGGNEPPFLSAGFIPLNAIQIDGIVRSQRRRQINVGS